MHCITLENVEVKASIMLNNSEVSSIEFQCQTSFFDLFTWLDLKRLKHIFHCVVASFKPLNVTIVYHGLYAI